MRGRPRKDKSVETKQPVKEVVKEKKEIKDVIKEDKKELVESKQEKVSSTPKIVAKKKEDEVKTSTSVIDDIYGELLELTEEEDHFFPSGSLIIDSVLSNGLGIPAGKFISITSSEGVGKSSMCLHIARNCCAKGFRCLYIDTECGLNRSQLESFSMMPFVNNHTFVPKYIRTYRELDDLLDTALKDTNLKFIFLDSLTDVIPDQVLGNNISDMTQPGLDARAQSLLFRKYKFPLTKAGITVFFILQQRTKIAMSYGERSMDQGAGSHAAKHAMDIALELVKKDFLTKTIKGHDKPIPYGTECWLKSIKNRYAPPMIPMLIHIIFGRGVSNSGAIATALILNGIAKTPTKMKILIEYEGEMKEFLGKPRFEEFIKEHLDYYKNIVETKCGGIKLLRDEDAVKPVLNTQVEDTIENDSEGDEIDDVDNETI